MMITLKILLKNLLGSLPQTASEPKNFNGFYGLFL